ncbi:MAG: DUF2971 domain-containing protein [Pedobacter sp.]|nr:MAG: DUF2971 domain-containing protein [Pedobacter sp.]
MGNFPLTIISDQIAKSRGLLIFHGKGYIVMTGGGNHNYYCGYCTETIITKFNSLGVITGGAIQCPKCGTPNDLSIRPHKTKPQLMKDMTAEVSPKIMIVASPLWSSQSFSGNLNILSSELIDAFVDEQQSFPGILQHYTSYQGMAGIISTNSLWLTDISYMNDTSELNYGKELIQKCFDEKSNDVSDATRELFRRGFTSGDTLDPRFGYYATSFCSNSDLLSQWRAYGGGGNGYALGFSTNSIKLDQDCQLRKVIYDVETQKRLVDHTIDATISLFETERGGMLIDELDEKQILPAFAAFLHDHLLEYLFTFKHPAFIEENEIRLIYKFNKDRDLKNIKFRSYNSVPVPYMPLNLQSEKLLAILPLVSITHGPTLHPDLTKKSLSLMLEQNNYSHVELIGSATPLRL